MSLNSSKKHRPPNTILPSALWLTTSSGLAYRLWGYLVLHRPLAGEKQLLSS